MDEHTSMEVGTRAESTDIRLASTTTRTTKGALTHTIEPPGNINITISDNGHFVNRDTEAAIDSVVALLDLPVY
jgi:hypothetical protein